MRLKEKLRNYLTLKTHKSGAFSSAMRGHAFAIRSLFFRQNIFLLMAGLCFALFCFHLQNLLLFFFFSVSLSLAPFHSVFFETRLCCCTREKRVFFFLKTLLCVASFRASYLQTQSYIRAVLTDTIRVGKKARKFCFFPFARFKTILLSKTNKEENAIKNRSSDQKIAQLAANTQSA